MKFTDGYWLVRKDVTASYVHEVHETERTGDSLALYCPRIHVTHRLQMLDEMLLRVDLSSPAPDVIRVRLTHFAGSLNKGPSFKLRESPDTPVEIQDGEEDAVMTSGRLSVRVHKKAPFAMSFMDGEKTITRTGERMLGYMETREAGAFTLAQLNLDVGECVYGLGERFTAFVKNGQAVDIWNEDGGSASELAYKNVPFYLSNRGYGVFVNHPGRVSFEVGSEKVSRVQFSVPGESLEYFVIYGPHPKDVLQKYTALTGRPALPPPWSFGLWLSTSFTTEYNDQTVIQMADAMAQKGIPLSVFYIDVFWMKEYRWAGLEWNRERFPDPTRLLRTLKDKGIRTCVWCNPYIAQRTRMFEEGMEKGFLLRKPDGSVWQWDRWQPGMGVVDFTNPSAASWFTGKLKELMAMGVDCFKTDFGERIPTTVTWHDGSEPERMHNYFTLLYNRSVFNAVSEVKGKENALVFSRSATAGCQQFPVHWGGDCSASYESMAESLRGGLSLCLSGFGFWSHDIGGFEGTPTPDLYKRWAAFGLLSSHSRLHGNASFRAPWFFGEEAVEVLRFFTKLKMKLMPYIFSAACEAASTGVPVMRAMMLEFSDDPLCDHLDTQYMLGGALLVAPIFNPEGTAAYYLPRGVWTSFLTGQKIEGGCWRTERHDYMSVPFMVRPGALIATGASDERPEYDFADGVTVQAFELPDSGESATQVRGPRGEVELDVQVRRAGSVVECSFESSGKPWKLLLRGAKGCSRVEGAQVRVAEEGVALTPGAARGKHVLRATIS
jgi:alpha-D-xyloside xylohydrolase